MTAVGDGLAARPSLPRTALSRLLRAARWVRWYVREVAGDSVYDRYVAHARACDPQAPVLSRRDFERNRTDEREADPRKGFRCC